MNNGINSGEVSRRGFLSFVITTAATLAASGLFGRFFSRYAQAKESGNSGKFKAIKVAVNDNGIRILLKNGFITDGTGTPGFRGDLLIKGSVIEEIAPGGMEFTGETVDCEGLVVSPGFIDMHSHMDGVLPAEGHDELKTPFTAQGVTTFVAGNCGFGVAAYMKNSPHREMIEKRIMDRIFSVEWDTYGEFFDRLKNRSLTHNMAVLAGSGTTRMSMRGMKSDPFSPDEMKVYRGLLEEALDQGARGISYGLQYEPDIFATMEELTEIARLVKSRDAVITVHMKAYSALSPSYPVRPFGRAHNLLAIDDMLAVAKETGVKMQLSHLIFVGEKSWKTCPEALELIDGARKSGLDIQFDTYAYHCGVSVINVFLPQWFLARLPEAYESSSARRKLRMEMYIVRKLLGFGYRDIQVTNAIDPELVQYNGMFVDEIAKARKMDELDCLLDISRRTNGAARVLNHRYSKLENVHDMIRHPAALFMTDAWVTPAGVQNPGAFGNFPLLLQYARDYKLAPMEDVVRKMTGASADRFKLEKRGYLKKGYAADITVFNWNTIKDNTTREHSDAPPTGIAGVFVNGKRVLANGTVDASVKAGVII
ncbi:MAG TPA: amidohydrolase family protein [Spirochaetota bacterium]|nr:amidohydrolase family protein [Spirochaetota bacterium]